VRKQFDDEVYAVVRNYGGAWPRIHVGPSNGDQHVIRMRPLRWRCRSTVPGFTETSKASGAKGNQGGLYFYFSTWQGRGV